MPRTYNCLSSFWVLVIKDIFTLYRWSSLWKSFMESITRFNGGIHSYCRKGLSLCRYYYFVNNNNNNTLIHEIWGEFIHINSGSFLKEILMNAFFNKTKYSSCQLAKTKYSSYQLALSFFSMFLFKGALATILSKKKFMFWKLVNSFKMMK